MPVSIVSNLSSQFSQQSIQLRNENISTRTQQLSSGQRVFAASEDPAAMAVGSALAIENAALSKAQINAAGGVSTLQIADGSLSQIGDIAIRLKALSIQASSGQVGDSERRAIDLEFQALKNEIDRISADTEFNGVPLLAGKPAFNLQGAHSYTNDGVSGLTFDSALVSSDAVFRYSYDSTNEEFTMTRIDGGTSTTQTIDVTGLLDSLAGTSQNLAAGQEMVLYFNGVGVNVTLGSAFDRTVDLQPTVTDGSGADITLTTPTFTPATTNLTLEGVTALQGLGAGFYNAATGEVTLDLTTDSTTVVLGGETGLRFEVNGGGMGADGADSADLVGGATLVDVYITTVSGSELLGQLNLGAVSTAGTTAGTISFPLGQGIIGAEYEDNNAPTTLTYAIGTGVVAGQDLLQVDIPAVTVAALGLTDSDITTKTTADDAIVALESVLDIINQARATLGAQQSRLEFVARNLNTVVENNVSARSALIDVDVPEAITALTNDQAMLEVGVSMLSQSNRLPQILLQLLRQS